MIHVLPLFFTSRLNVTNSDKICSLKNHQSMVQPWLILLLNRRAG